MVRSILDMSEERYEKGEKASSRAAETKARYRPESLQDLGETKKQLRQQMLAAAADLNFERAAELRDQIKELEDLELVIR